MKKRINWLTAIMAVLMCLTVVLNLRQTVEPLDLGEELIDLVGRWETHSYTEDGEVHTEYTLTIPNDLKDERYFSFQIYYSSIEVWVDDELVYHYEDEENRQGSFREWFELPADAAGKTLHLRSSNGEEFLKNTIEGESYIGELSTIMLRFLTDNFFVLCISVTLLFLSFALGVALLKFRVMRSHSNVRAMGYLCLFLFVSGMWILSDSQLLRLVSGRTAGVETFSYVMFMQMPFWVLRLLNEMMIERRKSFDSMCGLLAACISIILFLHICRIVRLGNSLIFYHALVLLSIVVVVVGVERETRLYADTSIRQIRIGIVLLLALSVGAIFMFYINATFKYSILYAVGLAIFSLSMLFDVMDNLQGQMKKSVQADIYYELAYKDALTGLENRAALVKEQARHSEVQDLAYIMIDLNGLKKINDKMGHLEGDKHIRLAADCIHAVFGAIGKCYRIGGDEFLICMENTNPVSLDGKLFELDQLTHSKRKKPPLSLASGYAFRRQGETLKELLDRADKAMYERKVEMKKAEGL